MAFERRLSRDQAEAVLARAIELDSMSADDGFTVDQLRRIAEEMGVSRTSLEASLRELPAPPQAGGGVLDRIVGPTRVVVERPTPRSAAAAASDLQRRLERLNLTKSSDRVWVQRLDWWPDAHRISAPTVLEIDAVPATPPRPALLRVRADVGEARRNHVASAAAGAALVPLAVFGLPVTLLTATAIGVVLGAVGSYRLRLRGVEERIVRMLEAVTAPNS